MLFTHIGILDETFTYQPDCFVGTRGEKIAYIGTQEPEEPYGERYDGTGKVLLPAFVNAHSHAPMTLLRGYAENLNLSDWLQTRIFPFEAQMDGEDIYYGSLLAFAEMMRFGTVSASDMYYHGDRLGQAVLESGMKCNTSIGVTCFDESDLCALDFYRQNEALRQSIHLAGDGRLRLDLSIHAEYTSTPRVVQQMADYAKETGLRVQVHLSETKAEHEECKARHAGKTPAAYFAQLGLFDVPVTAAHCVWLEEEDFDILREKGVTVANCPVSNMKLASGFCNVPALLRHGVSVALGTDGPASNNNLNLMEEMKLFGLLYKAVANDPTAVTPQQALYAATRAGALSQGREDCGAIRVGNRADLTVLDVSGPWMQPVHDMCSSLVFSAQGSDVCLTMADGRILYRDGVYLTVDVEKAAFYVKKSADRICRAVSR